jgi:hypothetical protein
MLRKPGIKFDVYPGPRNADRRQHDCKMGTVLNTGLDSLAKRVAKAHFPVVVERLDAGSD